MHYHLQLLHPQLFATLERHPLLLGVLQRVVPHGGAEADDDVHPADGQREITSSAGEKMMSGEIPFGRTPTFS